MSLKAKIIDSYLANPIFLDFVLVGISLVIWHYFPQISFKIPEKTNQLNILASLISTSVSLAGFMLAALTIIVTFKSNLQAKGIENAENALELIFSSKHYPKIIQVFKKGIIELILLFLAMYTAWILVDNIDVTLLHQINAGSMILIVSTIARSLYILFDILNLENYRRS